MLWFLLSCSLGLLRTQQPGSGWVWSAPAPSSGGKGRLCWGHALFLRKCQRRGHRRKNRIKEMLLFPKESNSSAISCGTSNPTEELFRQGRAKSAPRNVTRGHGEDGTRSHQQTPVPRPAFAPRSDSAVTNESGLLEQNYLIFMYGRKRGRRKIPFLSTPGASSVQGLREPPPAFHQPPEKPSSTRDGAGTLVPLSPT